MRSYDAATLAALQTRAGVVARVLIVAEARNRTTNVLDTLCLWNGAEPRDFTIAGVTRTFYGAGSLLDIPPIVMESGLRVRFHRLSLSPLSPEVADLIRVHDPRFAPLRIYRALFSPETGALIAEPHRMWKGFIDDVSLPTPKAGGVARCDVKVASSARQLTQTLPLKRSDETQRRRSGDRMLRYVDVSGSVDVWWGEARAVVAAPAAAAPPSRGSSTFFSSGRGKSNR
jgi:hypothetical protein